MYSARHFFNINDLFRQASNRKIMIPIRIRSKTSGSFLSILYPQHRKYLSMRTAFLGRIHILLFALSFFFGPKCPPALWLNLLCGLQRRELHKISHSDLNVEYFTHILPQSSRNFSLPYNPVVTTVLTTYRRRIYTDEKAKVVAALLGT